MTDAIYLTPAEIKKLHQLPLEPGTTLCTIRDRFVIGCVTGLRYSDYSRFGPGHVMSGVINILTKKRDKKVFIPAHKYVMEILKRNKNEIPKAPTLRYFNMKLPEIGLKAGIRASIMVEAIEKSNGESEYLVANDFIDGLTDKGDRKVVTKMLPKHDLITTHTARRSFATNAYLAGIPTARIMLITGHSTEKSFFRYIRIAAAQNANELKDHDFFKGR